MKTMLYKNFMQHFNRSKKSNRIEIESNFRPECRGLCFFFSHKFPIIGFYDESSNCTYIWTKDEGLLYLMISDLDEGVFIRLEGKYTNEDFIEGRINLNKLMTFLFWQSEIEMAKKERHENILESLKNQKIPYCEIKGFNVLTV